jgi:hypothetical protein
LQLIVIPTSFAVVARSFVVLRVVRMVTSRVLKNVMSDGLSRQILPKKRSLWVINEHFEAEFNALRPSAIVFQHPARD